MDTELLNQQIADTLAGKLTPEQLLDALKIHKSKDLKGFGKAMRAHPSFVDIVSLVAAAINARDNIDKDRAKRIVDKFADIKKQAYQTVI